MSWDGESGEGSPLQESSHDNQVMQMVYSGAQLVSAGMDDTLRISTVVSGNDVSVISTGGLPKGVSTSDDQTVVVTTESEVRIVQNGKKVGSLAVGYSATAVAISPQGSTVAIGSQVRTVTQNIFCDCLESLSPLSPTV
jgi:hypothetical protein